jgi:VCBS repeat protein
MPRPINLDLIVLEPRHVPASFTPFAGSPLAVGVSPGGVEAADLDSDGDLDLATANFGSNTSSVLLNNGSASFTADSPVATANNPYAVTAAELDGDGRLDLITTNSGSSSVTIVRNTTTLTADVQVSVP